MDQHIYQTSLLSTFPFDLNNSKPNTSPELDFRRSGLSHPAVLVIGLAYFGVPPRTQETHGPMKSVLELGIFYACTMGRRIVLRIVWGRLRYPILLRPSLIRFFEIARLRIPLARPICGAESEQ